MIFEEKTVTLRDGRECTLRSPSPDDAAGMLAYLRQTSAETRFMVRDADEIVMTLREEKKHLSDMLVSHNSMMIAAFLDGRPVGCCGIGPVLSHRRLLHRASFGVSIIREAWGLGIGTALLTEAIESARRAGFEQLELGVVSGNERAIALYTRFGFKLCGTLPNAFRYDDGSYADEHTMFLRL